MNRSEETSKTKFPRGRRYRFIPIVLEVGFRFGDAEVGHMHTGGVVDIPFPRSIRDAVLEGPCRGEESGMEEGLLAKCPEGRGELADISEEEILQTVREYPSGRKKLPEITVVARTKKELSFSCAPMQDRWQIASRPANDQIPPCVLKKRLR